MEIFQYYILEHLLKKKKPEKNFFFFKSILIHSFTIHLNKKPSNSPPIETPPSTKTHSKIKSTTNPWERT